MVWTRRSEARLDRIENALRRMEQEARRLRTENGGLRTKLAADTADALRTIDAHKAAIDDLERRLQPAGPGAAQGNAPAGDPWFRGQAATPPGGVRQQTAAPVRTRMIETFELEGTPQSSARDPRNGAELVADAVARPVSAWLPAGAHAEAVVLAGVDASAGVSSQGDPRPVLLRITGPAWTAAEDGTALQVDVDGCTVTGAAHGDLSSEKVYVRFRTMTCAGPEPGTVIETEVAGFVAGSGKTGVRGPVVSREGALVETANHDGDYREECFAMLAGVIGRMARRRGGIDDIEAALIAEAIAAAWDEAGNAADLGTVRKNLEARSDRRAADMATSLGPWCPGGAMGRLFAGSNVPDLENAMTVFELAELKGRGDVQAVVLMLVVFLATQRMYHGPRTRTKAIVIDEVWDLLSGEDSRTFLEGAARRAHKYRGALVTGTQSVNDYYAIAMSSGRSGSPPISRLVK